MFYIKITLGVLFKMAQIWLPMMIVVITLLAIVTAFKNDNRWIIKTFKKIGNV